MSRQRKKKGRPISGWVVLDKPAGLGSTEAVARIKRLYQAAKAGHAGTLDPLASGMLPIALGEATKTVPYVMDSHKLYRFGVTWGAETETDDLEGNVCARSDERPGRELVEQAAAEYVGEIDQVPPAFSAIKIDGERAYNLARQGEKVEIASRTVIIERLDVVEHDENGVTLFECECGKGTYVRALARDIGRELGCFGHVSQLRRIGVGPFCEDDMVELVALEDLEGDLDALDGELLPTGAALDMLPEVPVSSGDASRIRAGNGIILRGRDAPTYAEEAIAVQDGELVAIGAVERGAFQPRRVFKFSGV